MERNIECAFFLIKASVYSCSDWDAIKIIVFAIAVFLTISTSAVFFAIRAVAVRWAIECAGAVADMISACAVCWVFGAGAVVKLLAGAVGDVLVAGAVVKLLASAVGLAIFFTCAEVWAID